MEREKITLSEICAYGFWFAVFMATFTGLVTTILKIIPVPILSIILSFMVVWSLLKSYPGIMLIRGKRLLKVILITVSFSVMPILFSIFFVNILTRGNYPTGSKLFFMFYSCISIPYLSIIYHNLKHPKKDELKKQIDDLSVGLTFSTSIVTIFLSIQSYVSFLNSDLVRFIGLLLLGPFSFNLMAIGVIQYNCKKNILDNTDTSAEY